MSTVLDPAVQAAVDAGQIRRLDLIRFDLPGRTVGYHRGGRPFTYNGLTYLPNRYLSAGSMNSALGVAVTTRTITFSNIPTADVNDAIAKIEEFNYLNAPVIIAHICGDPATDQVLGVLASSIYEIDKVKFNKSAITQGGERNLTLSIDLQPPGRSARGSTQVKRSQEEQQFDNALTDTCLEYASVTGSQPVEWGQR
ncbi:DUF2163 domain-containing protein [Phyllobacterium calauticae]|jgi:hypothetical protein|uniref:DUF2163 domain-containing protein n=1 Tax=Phyllobacterium calauticae TaxID=2817027 RepID=UPI001CBCF9F6|nr:DUF2163 domain-containing protein [Phyllobacterium calauticae]MBZ3690980.1 DUF2163 domain-containing protein [Phyllobacterium calauticae]